MDNPQPPTRDAAIGVHGGSRTFETVWRVAAHGIAYTEAGISGSGKSSLAFDTIYAEGARQKSPTFRTPWDDDEIVRRWWWADKKVGHNAHIAWKLERDSVALRADNVMDRLRA